MSIRAGIVIAVTFKKVNDAPDTKACADGSDKGLEDRNCASKKCHTYLSFLHFAKQKEPPYK